jgi:Mg2+/Co2+ transporter CorC
MNTSQIKLVEAASSAVVGSIGPSIYRLGNGKHPFLMHLNTPAVDIIRGPKNQLGLTVDKSFSLDQAVDVLQILDMRLLVVTGDDQRVLGILHASDALGEKPMMLIHERGLLHSDIVVGDVMAPVADMHVIECTDAHKMSVKDIVAELDNVGKSWAIAVSGDDAQRRIEGVFFAPDIVRQIDPVATWAPGRRTFAAIEAAISH